MAALPLHTQAGPDTPEQAKMRAALRRMMEQSSGTTPTTTPPPAPAPAPPPANTTPSSPAPVPAAPPPAPATRQSFDSVPQPDDSAKLNQARTAMREKLAESQAAPAPDAPTSPVAPAPIAHQPPAQPVAPPPPPAPGYTPIEAPASPLSASKQARLADLLVRYKADAITAQEYHTKRAAIIAEP